MTGAPETACQAAARLFPGCGFTIANSDDAPAARRSTARVFHPEAEPGEEPLVTETGPTPVAALEACAATWRAAGGLE